MVSILNFVGVIEQILIDSYSAHMDRNLGNAENREIVELAEIINFDIKNKTLRSAISIFLDGEHILMRRIRSISDIKVRYVLEIFGSIIFITFKHLRRSGKL